MKLNNKGISIVEIVVTFALIMVMVVQMITIVINYREKASLSLKELDLETFKNTLTRDIQKDISELGVKEINTTGECLTATNLNQCINIVFDDGSEKIFGTSKIDASKHDTIENKYLYYGTLADGLKYKLKDKLPDKIPSGRDVLSFQSIRLEDNNMLSTDTVVLDDGSTISIYSIDVYISHINYDQDFGIHIVASTDDKQVITDENRLKSTAVLTIGQSVTGIDGSKWHVLENSYSDNGYVTLLSDYNLNTDGSYNTKCGGPINSTYKCSTMSFDADNTNIYDETDSNNVGYFIKSIYAPIVKNSLPGTTDVTLPTTKQVAAIDNVEYVNTAAISSSWLLTTNYWLVDNNTEKVYAINGSAAYLLYTTSSISTGFGARPVITTLKTNLYLN